MMTDKPITRADLDAFRGEIVEALRTRAGASSIIADIADRLANPPKPKAPIMGRTEWLALSSLPDESSIYLNSYEGDRLLNLARAIVSGEVELPRYKEER